MSHSLQQCSPPGSSVRGILQASMLDWVAISFSRNLPDPGIEPRVSPTAGRFATEPPGKPRESHGNLRSSKSHCVFVFMRTQAQNGKPDDYKKRRTRRGSLAGLLKLLMCVLLILPFHFLESPLEKDFNPHRTFRGVYNSIVYHSKSTGDHLGTTNKRVIK